jgi:hypothetical protein
VTDALDLTPANPGRDHADVGVDTSTGRPLAQRRGVRTRGSLQRLAATVGSLRVWLESLEPTAKLGRRGRLALWAIGILFVGFFITTLGQEIGRNPGKGDLDVFLRAGWAAREGQDIYQITDGHGFHYLYPPLFATLVSPLADPPPIATAAQRAFTLPYWLSASLYFWLCVAALFAALHMLASAAEATSATGPPPVLSRIWWARRVWPMLPALIWFGDAAGRGQSTPFLLLLVAGGAATMLRGQRGRAGAMIGFAGVLKLFPVYLLILPVLRLDRRMILGATLGVLIGVLAPVAVMGPVASLHAYSEFLGDRMKGEINGRGDPTVSQELHGTNSSIQSFEYMAYNTLHPDPQTRDPVPPTPYFIAHVAIAALLTLGLLWIMRRGGDPLSELLYLSALAVIMVPILPVSRPNSFAFEVLTFAALLTAEWPRRKGLWPGWPLVALAFATLLVGLLVAFGQREVIDFGVTTYSALWLATMAVITARRRSAAAQRGAPAERPDEGPTITIPDATVA